MILDFSLIVAMDSSAAHAIVKLKNILQNAMHLEVTIFVTGSPHGFPCEFALSEELSRSTNDDNVAAPASTSGQNKKRPSATRRGSVPFAQDTAAMRAALLRRNFPRSRVCSDLDSALIFAEDVLIARADATFTHSENRNVTRNSMLYSAQIAADATDISLDDELSLVTKYISNIYVGTHSQDGRCSMISDVIISNARFSPSHFFHLHQYLSWCVASSVKSTTRVTFFGNMARTVIVPRFWFAVPSFLTCKARTLRNSFFPATLLEN